jgi:uroporphyrinogen decarboxylase
LNVFYKFSFKKVEPVFKIRILIFLILKQVFFIPFSKILMNDLFLQALHCRNSSSRVPIWLMRQAGRHLASYRALRARYSFLEMCHEPDLIASVTQLPLNAYQMDAAILFSDILVIPEAMGVGLRFEDKVGPIIERPLGAIEDIQQLPLPHDISTLNFVAKGIQQLIPQLQVPLIGFCGAPFTMASYMIEGKSSRDLKKTKLWMLTNPESFHSLLSLLAKWAIAYLRLQITAGVQAIQIFDSWANALAHSQFREFSLFYLKQIIEGIRDTGVPVILFCRGSSVFAPQLATLQPAGISLDWNCRVSSIREQVPTSIALQGNLDPDLLYAPLSVLEQEAKSIVADMKGDQGFIFNLGHGIAPDVTETAVKKLVDSVRAFS